MKRLRYLLLSIPLCAPLPGRADDRFHACLIEPFRKVEIRSPVEALISRIDVQRGSMVHENQVLVELDVSIEKAALAAATFRAAMEGEVKSAQTRVDYARAKLRRLKDLATRKLVSDQERDDAYSELRLAEAERLNAREKRALAGIEETRLLAEIERRRLRSPIDGVVMERRRHPGELAQTDNNAEAILELAQIDRLRVEVVLPTEHYGKVKTGDTGRVQLVEPLHGEYLAKVIVVDPVVDSASGTFGVRLELPNPGYTIPPGVKCRVRFAPGGEDLPSSGQVSMLPVR